MAKISTRQSSNDLAFFSIEEAARLLRSKKISPVDLTEAALQRIDRLNGRLKAYLTVLSAPARKAARAAEKEIMRGNYRGPLHGIPICLKDNLWTRGIRTTAGSLILRDFIPPTDSAVAARLRRAGAILLGKTNMHEFAYGITSINPHYGWVRNPWNEKRISGGSSGGSGAALAAGLAYGSVGTDTGGSIRTPAAFCGIVGFKPTYGRVSLRGVVPLAARLDHVGPMGRTVMDVALLLQSIAGTDDWDYGEVAKPVPAYSKVLRRGARGLRLGWPVRGCYEGASPEVQNAVDEAAHVLKSQGATLHAVSLQGAEAALGPANVVAGAEAATFHVSAGYFPERVQEYGRDVRKRLRAGVRISAVDFLRALATREILLHIFESAFEKVDAILAPALPMDAQSPTTENVWLRRREESIRHAVLRFCRPANFTGLPAISVPCGFTSAGLPIGLQIIGPHWQEARILQIAYFYEQATEWHQMHPSL
jgi:aspartyl-tRNA(Asn)/glutamyl-tRNA(Gln) amidotransferase subunit A